MTVQQQYDAEVVKRKAAFQKMLSLEGAARRGDWEALRAGRTARRSYLRADGRIKRLLKYYREELRIS